MTFLYIVLGFVAVGSYGLYRFFNRFGGLINKTLSKSYFYTKKKDAFLYCPNGNWFSLGETKMEVDQESFIVLSGHYAKDKDYAYYTHTKIMAPIDLATFEIKEDHIPIDKNNVYCFKAYNDYKEDTDVLEPILEADPKTYKSLDYNWNTDDKHVFLYNKVTKELDVNSFNILSRFFCVDKNGVYYYNFETKITKICADSQEIEVLDDDYICDHKSVYFYNDDAFSEQKLFIFPYKDRKKVHLYNNFYLRVDDNVFFLTVVVEGVDIPSLEVFDYRYAKDKNNVYYDGKIIEAADVTTFKKAENDFDYCDKNHTYKFGEIMEIEN